MFIQYLSIVIIGIALCLLLNKHGNEFALVITIILCCFLFGYTLEYLKSVISLSEKLRELSGINVQIFKILIKSVGIGLLSEIVMLICNDVGYSAIGKAVQLAGGITILWLSIPLFDNLLDLVEKILNCA